MIEVKVISDKLDDDKLLEIDVWLALIFYNWEYHRLGRFYYFYFENANEAMRFKLTWC
jgi:hypothetical protein